MIGPVERRPGHMAPWGYRSSDGFGLPEFLLWCRQLGAEPILGLFAGYVLNGDHFKAGSPELAEGCGPEPDGYGPSLSACRRVGSGWPPCGLHGRL